MIRIRSYTAADRAALVPLMIGSYVYYGEPAPPKRDVEKWLKKLPAGVEVLVAADGKALAGFISFGTLLPAGTTPRLYIQDFYISPKYRRKGFGARLMAKVAALAVKRGYDRVTWSVLDANTGAVRFYKKLGAEARPHMIYHRLMGKNLKALAKKSVRA